MVGSNDTGHPPARLLVVDDHPMLRRSIRHRLEIEDDITVCGEAGSLTELRRAVVETRPDIVLLDMRLGEEDAVPAIRWLRETSPGLSVLVFSIHSPALYAKRCLEAGADGYLAKAEAADQLLPAIRAVLQGRVYDSAAGPPGRQCNRGA